MKGDEIGVRGEFIRVEAVFRDHAGPPRVQALRGVDLAIGHGEFLAIVGASGAGKSTLLNLLGLLDRPSSGRILINGADTSALDERTLDRLRGETIGFVFQDSLAVPGRTTAANVDLPLRLHGKLDIGERQRRVAAELDRVGLGHRTTSKVAYLSGGEQQRMAVARALVSGPTLLLADEPTGNLDSQSASTMIGLLRTARERGATVVVVTHDQRVAAAADRTVTLSDGRIIDDSASAPGRPLPDTRPCRGPADSDTAEGHMPSARQATFRAWAADASDALFALFASPGRSLLLLAVISLAVCGLVAAQGISRTASQEVSVQLTRQALDEVTVQPPSSRDPLVEAHRDAVRALEGVIGVSDSWQLGRGEIAPGILPPGVPGRELERVSQVLAVEGAYFALREADVLPAHAPSLLDHREIGAQGVIIGRALEDQLGHAVAGARQLWISGRPLAVIGTADFDDDVLDHTVFLSSAVVDSLDAGGVQSMLIRTKPGAAYAVAQAVPFALDAASPSRFTVSQPPDLRELRRGVSTSLDGALLSVSVVLTVISVVSIGSVLTSAVSSRLREIGLRRAMGAARGRVARLFLIQGTLLGLAGGVLGAALGVLCVIGVSLARSWTPVLAVTDPFIAAAVGGAVGVLASVYPAWRASGIDPALAVRDRA